MRFRRRRATPLPYWIAACEFEPQGLLEVWISRHGRPALVCDECAFVWFDPEALAVESAYLPPAGTADLAGDDTLDPPHARLATRADLEALGWWQYIPQASRAQHGGDG